MTAATTHLWRLLKWGRTLARHGALDLTVRAKGDLEIDAHHTVEDIGITCGQALRQALELYVLHFPVYRTYIDEDVHPDDRRLARRLTREARAAVDELLYRYPVALLARDS